MSDYHNGSSNKKSKGKPTPITLNTEQYNFDKFEYQDKSAQVLAVYCEWHRRHPLCKTPPGGIKSLDDIGEPVRQDPDYSNYAPLPEVITSWKDGALQQVTQSLQKREQTLKLQEPWRVASVREEIHKTHDKNDFIMVPPPPNETYKERRTNFWKNPPKSTIIPPLQPRIKTSLDNELDEILQRNKQKQLDQLTEVDDTYPQPKKALEDVLYAASILPIPQFGQSKARRAAVQKPKPPPIFRLPDAQLKCPIPFHGVEALAEFPLVQRELLIQKALSLYEQSLHSDKKELLAVDGKLSNSTISKATRTSNHTHMITSTADILDSDKHTKKKSPKKSRKATKEIPVDMEKVYEDLKLKIGGQAVLNKMANEWIELAEKGLTDTTKETSVYKDLCFTDACERGLVKTVEGMLKEGQDPDGRSNGEPALLLVVSKIIKLDEMLEAEKITNAKRMKTVRELLFAILKLLLEYLATVDIIGNQQCTALHLCCRACRVELVQVLLDAGANSNRHTEDAARLTPLMISAQQGQVPLLALLLRKHAILDSLDSEQQSALHHAGISGKSHAAVFLVRVGANKSILNKAGNSAAIAAEKNNQFITAQLIMATSGPSDPVATAIDFLYHKEVLNDGSDSDSSDDDNKARKVAAREKLTFITRIKNFIKRLRHSEDT